MKLSILLYILLLKLRFAAWKDAGFRKLLGKRDYTLVIRTADSMVGRSFTFAGGRVVSKRGELQALADSERVLQAHAEVALRAVVAAGAGANSHSQKKTVVFVGAQNRLFLRCGRDCLDGC